MQDNKPLTFLGVEVPEVLLPGGIEAQERAGQAMTNLQQTLPVHMINCTRADFEALGFVFGEALDDLFVKVTFPAGWRKQATTHAMHSDLLDNKARRRGGIFYKAAFYDRRADVNLRRRYTLERYAECDQEGQAVADRHSEYLLTSIVDHDGTVVHTIGVRGSRDFELSDAHKVMALTWLTEHLPAWASPAAYWD